MKELVFAARRLIKKDSLAARGKGGPRSIPERANTSARGVAAVELQAGSGRGLVRQRPGAGQASGATRRSVPPPAAAGTAPPAGANGGGARARTNATARGHVAALPRAGPAASAHWRLGKQDRKPPDRGASGRCSLIHQPAQRLRVGRDEGKGRRRYPAPTASSSAVGSPRLPLPPTPTPAAATPKHPATR